MNGECKHGDHALWENNWQTLLSQSGIPQDNSPLDDSLWEACSGTSHIFAKALQLGRIRGIVGIFSQGLISRDQIAQYKPMITELLQRDILLISFGPAATAIGEEGLTSAESLDFSGDGLAEFCTNLDIDPVLVMGKANNFDRFHEFCSLTAGHAGTATDNLPLAILVIDEAQKHQDDIELYDFSGRAVLPPETGTPINADHIDAYIHAKRLDIPWCDRYHCTIFS